MTRGSVRLAPEVVAALEDGRAVVALESTLIAHGLPWPQNLETARDSEAAVRLAGAAPATIAVIGGIIHVGLAEDELEGIARASSFLKASRRDLAPVVARGLDAATTVSATVWIAREVGIGVMATGGLGGVHRGAAESFDVSTDLDELARADGMVVVCSGVKSILDIPATLENLETRGVAVIGYRTEAFPAFTTVSSGLSLEWRADSAEDVARIARAHRAMRLPGAIVLAQPVPDAVAIAEAEMDAALVHTLAEAQAQGIGGKAITPFLLDAIRRVTEGRSLVANRALIVANAVLAGEVAARLAEDRASKS
ncbi:MAG: putative enzyme involved in pigment biosynthesis [Planctomycetota bacterium]|nr:putative enzyme involved in pigment biosynthesis [Planctomycetota bacterium]